MYTISTTTMVSILALASSLAIVVQTNPIAGCTSTVRAAAPTCKQLAAKWNNGATAADLADWLHKYNDNVDIGCTNLTVGQFVRVRLLQTRLYTRGMTKG